MSKAKASRRGTLSVAEVVATYQRMRAIEAALAGHDLSAFLVALLASFGERPGVTIGTVAKTFGFATSVATGGVDRLEARGLMRRIGRPVIGSTRDRRTIVVEVTDQGRAVLALVAEIEVER
jgi:DNA-binding MarR family transcriptional regulator